MAQFDAQFVCVLLQGQILAKNGIDPRRFIGRPITETLPGDAGARAGAVIARALAGSSGTVEVTIAGRTYLYDVWPYRLDSGAIAGAFAVGRDITERIRADEQLRMFATIVRQSDDAIVVCSPAGAITHWNDGALRMYGYTAQEAVGRELSLLAPYGREDELAEPVRRALAGSSTQLQTTHRCHDGRGVLVSLTVAPINGPDGEVLGISALARDITTEMQAQEALRNSERQSYDAQALAHVGSWDRGVGEPRAAVSAELCRIFGQSLDFSPTDEELLALTHPDDRPVLARAFADAAGGIPGEYEYRIVRPDGEHRHVHQLSNPRRDPDGAVTHMFAAIQDITERKRYEATLERLATHDGLTGLPNRRTFDERLAAEIARAARHGRGLSLALMDVDHFKRINDLLGHPAGDRVLAGIARALRAIVREHELIARVGGEEFAWILPDAQPAGAHTAVRRALTAVAGAEIRDVPRITLSAGICEIADGVDGTELYRRADIALLRAKQTGRDRIVIYTADCDREILSADRSSTLRWR